VTHIIRRCALAVLLVLTSAFGTTYTFTKVTDNGPSSQFSLSPFAGPFLINNNGVVAFAAQRRDAKGDTVSGIYTSSGNGITTIVEDSVQLVLSGFNDSGTVVYVRGANVYSASAGTQPFLVLESTNDFTINGLTLPKINNAGTIAIASQSKIVTRTGTGPVQTLLSDTDLPRSIALLASQILGASINNGGTVAFYAGNVASGTTCSCGLFTKDSGSLTSILPLTSNLSVDPQINDSGAVAFYGAFQGSSGVYLVSGGKVGTAIDLSKTPFTFQGFSFNNKGQVIIEGQFGGAASVSGVFTGSDKVANRVIATGDSLFGGVVAGVNAATRSSGGSLNDKGQIAFSYRLNDATTGIGIATPVDTGTPPPTLAANGIVNGASFSTDNPASPGSIVSLFGANFITDLAVAPGDPLPTSLNGVNVKINGIDAPLFFVAPSQINAQVPFGVTGTSASVQVFNSAGQSEVRNISTKPQSPAIFTIDQTGVGQGVVVFGNTATLVGPVRPGTDWRPGKAGDVITIYANGLGAVNPPINDGWNSCDQSTCKPDLSNLTLRFTTVRPTVKIGNVTAPDSSIQFSGLAPQFAGLYQINLTIPSGITPGDNVPIILTMGGISSASNVHIALQ
jgi:uncharacterized protein (TIGR03437 family)